MILHWQQELSQLLPTAAFGAECVLAHFREASSFLESKLHPKAGSLAATVGGGRF